jgi:cytochrome c-type biogenesis protein CcmH
MTWFLVAAAVLSLVVLAILLRPLIGRSRSDGEDAEPAAVLFRRQFAAVDEELAEGRLPPEEAEAARTEITRRLLAAADHDEVRSDMPARRRSENGWRFGAAIGIAGVLPAAALAVYFAVGTPAAIERHAGVGADPAAPHSAADLAAAADEIKAHLQKAPGDLKGWTLLGRTLASLDRFPEALDAYNHALALAPDNASLHAEFGEVLVLQAQGAVTPAAETEFAKAPEDPRSRYYGAEAALQHGDPAAAKRKLQALLADAPADAPWRQTVADRLAELLPGGAPGGASAGTAGPSPSSAAAAVPGPTAQDVAAAQSMTPEQRQAMIRGMVDRLAQRLEQHPDDKPGWERLARAYDVLGEPDKAQAARARAAGGDKTAAAPAPPSTTAPTVAGSEQTATAASAAPAAAPSAAASTLPAPSDAQGWIERARTDQGQGRTEDALAALKEGNAAFPGNLPLLEAYMNALAGGLKDDKPTPEFVVVATQVNALDGREPDALWYLGIAAADNGDRFRAASYWTKLLAVLPSGDPQRAVVQHRLDALR